MFYKWFHTLCSKANFRMKLTRSNIVQLHQVFNKRSIDPVGMTGCWQNFANKAWIQIEISKGNPGYSLINPSQKTPFTCHPVVSIMIPVCWCRLCPPGQLRQLHHDAEVQSITHMYKCLLACPRHLVQCIVRANNEETQYPPSSRDSFITVGIDSSWCVHNLTLIWSRSI